MVVKFYLLIVVHCIQKKTPPFVCSMPNTPKPIQMKITTVVPFKL